MMIPCDGFDDDDDAIDGFVDICIYMVWYGDLHMVLWLYTFGCLVFHLATDPLWADLCRGRIVGRFSSYKKAPVETVEGGDYELIEGKVT